MHLAHTPSPSIAPHSRRGDNRAEREVRPMLTAGLPCLAAANLKGIRTPALLRRAGRLLTLI